MLVTAIDTAIGVLACVGFSAIACFVGFQFGHITTLRRVSERQAHMFASVMQDIESCMSLEHKKIMKEAVREMNKRNVRRLRKTVPNFDKEFGEIFPEVDLGDIDS